MDEYIDFLRSLFYVDETDKDYRITTTIFNIIQVTICLLCDKEYRSRHSVPITALDLQTFVADIYLRDNIRKNVVLITVDKYDNLDKAVLQNLNLLQACSLSEDSRNSAYFYGIASDLKSWRFCCYIRPDRSQLATEKDFMVSDTFGLAIQEEKCLIEPESLRKILKATAGFIKKSLDQEAEKSEFFLAYKNL